MIGYLICGEVFTLLMITAAPDSYRDTARKSPSLPWVGSIAMVLVWPFTVVLVIFYAVRYLWRLR